MDPQPKSGKGKVVAAVLVLGAVGVGGAVFLARQDAKTKRAAIDAAWGKSIRCLLGSAPTNAADATARARAFQLAVIGKPQTDAAGAWPARCEEPARALQKTLLDGASVLPKTENLRTAIEAMLKELHGSAGAEAVAGPIGKVFGEGLALGLSGVATEGLAPPKAVAVFAAHELPKETRISGTGARLANVQVAPMRGDTLVFTVEGEGSAAPIVCASTAQKLVCKPSNAKVPTGAHPFGSADEGAPPVLFAGGLHGDRGIFRADTGESLGTLSLVGAHVAADGALSYVTWDEKGEAVHLVQKGKDEVVATRKDDRVHRMGVTYAWGDLFIERFDPELGHALFTRKLVDGKPEDTEVGRVVPFSGLSETTPRHSACRSGSATVMRVVGSGSESIAFHLDGRWFPPRTVAGAGGTLSCTASDAYVTRVVDFDGPTVTAWHCTVTKCEPWRIDLREAMKNELPIAPSNVKHVQALEMGGKLGVVYRAGDQGGLRLRIARAEEFAGGSDTVVFDDLRDENGAAPSTLKDFRLLPGKGHAILLLSTTAGVHAYRLLPSGAAAPAVVER